MSPTLILLAGTLWAAPVAPAAAPAPLIPRALFFSNPERTSPQLSPDGSLLAWLQPDAGGVLQLWTRPVESPDAPPRQVTREKGRGVRRYLWAYNGDLLFFQDEAGDERFRLYAVRLSDGRVLGLTSVAGVRPCDLQLSPKKPGQAVVVRNQRRGASLFAAAPKATFEAWRVDLRTGDLRPLELNTGDVSSWFADELLEIRARVRVADDGSARLEAKEGEGWRTVLTWGLRDTVDPLALSPDGKRLQLLSNLGADTLGLDVLDLATGKRRRVAGEASSDIQGVDVHPVTRQVRAVAYNRSRTRWQALDASVNAELAALARVDSGDLYLLGGDQADTRWVVMFDRDTSSGRAYLWDRVHRSATLLFVFRPELEKLALATMKPVEIRARDGLSLPSLLTLPRGVPARSLPLVLLVHGGPWTRDVWGYDGLVQFLASRGWAVLQVNYRGSEGFGKQFKNAAIHQFGRRMHDDLVDGVRWAVAQGVADPKRVAIMGDSYGGYATLWALTASPELFACGVDLFGPSNLVTLLEGLPPNWAPFLSSTWHPFVGDPKDPKARPDLLARSPLFRADRIRAPLLIGQGANDPRVPQRESEQMLEAIGKAGGRATYVLYPDEGHGFVRPENRLDFYARTERFLAGCLGGRFEPLGAAGVPGSTPQVREVGARGE